MKNIEIIKKAFEGGHTVFAPTNSFTVDNPNIMHNSGLNLWGVYFLKKKELKNPAYILRRLIYSRLAYIGTMRTILIIESELSADNSLVEKLEKYFDYVVIFDGEKSLPELMKILSTNSTTEKFPISNKLRQRNTSNFFTFVDKFNERDYNPGNYSLLGLDTYNAISVQNPFSTKLRSTNLHEIDNIIAFSKDYNSRSFIEIFENSITNTMLNRFAFSEKKLVINDDRYCIANTNIDFHNLRNGSQYINTLCFMGIFPISVNKNEQLNGII